MQCLESSFSFSIAKSTHAYSYIKICRYIAMYVTAVSLINQEMPLNFHSCWSEWLTYGTRNQVKYVDGKLYIKLCTIYHKH